MTTMRNSLLSLLALTALAASPPSPPSGLVNPILPLVVPISVTNVTLVYNNIAVKTPTLDFQNVTIYGGTNVFNGSLVVAWNASPDTNVVGYNVYYGPTTLAQTNKYTTLKHVTAVMFSGVLQTNYSYWFNVTAFDSAGTESEPSDTLLVPGK